MNRAFQLACLACVLLAINGVSDSTFRQVQWRWLEALDACRNIGHAIIKYSANMISLLKACGRSWLTQLQQLRCNRDSVGRVQRMDRMMHCDGFEVDI